ASRSMERSTRPSYTSPAIAVARPPGPGTGQASSQSPQSMHSLPTISERLRTSTVKSPAQPVTDVTVVRRRIRRFGWSMATLRYRHFRTPGGGGGRGRAGTEMAGGEEGAEGGGAPADEGSALEELDGVPHPGQFDGRLRARDPTADDRDAVGTGTERDPPLLVRREANRHLGDPERLVGDGFTSVAVHPRAPLANVG